MHTPSQSEDDIFLKSSNAFWSSISNEMLIHVYINNNTQKLVSWLYFLLILLVSQHLIWYVKPYVICKFMALTWHTCQLKEPGKFEISLWYESRGSESCLPLNILRNTKLSCWHPTQCEIRGHSICCGGTSSSHSYWSVVNH